MLIWAGWFGVTRISVTGSLSVFDIVALRVGGGTLVLLPIFLPGARAIPRRAWGEAVILSICWGAPFVLLVGFGIQLTSATHAASVTPSIMPVIAAAIGWSILGERPPTRRIAGFAVIVAGVCALTLAVPGSGGLAGNAALIAGSALWAIYTLRVRRSGLTSLQAATLTCLYSAAGFLPFYVLSGVSRLGSASWDEIATQAVYQGLLVGGLSIVAFNRAIILLGPAGAALVTSLVPVAATLLAIPIAGETPGPLELAAILAIGVGVYVGVSAKEAG